MDEVIHKPGVGDMFVGVAVSVIASLAFLPVTGLVAILVEIIFGLSQGTTTGLLVVLSALISIVTFRVLWDSAVYER